MPSRESIQSKVTRYENATVESKIDSFTFVQALRARQIVEKAALEIQLGAMIRSRVDTGQMRHGWRLVKHDFFWHEVKNTVNHAVFNEFGTRYMTAQPMLVPAVEQTRPYFEAAVARLFKV